MKLSSKEDFCFKRQKMINLGQNQDLKLYGGFHVYKKIKRGQINRNYSNKNVIFMSY